MKDPAAANTLIETLNQALNLDWVAFSYQTLKAGHHVAGDDAVGDQTGQFDAQRWTTLYKKLLASRGIQRPIDPAIRYSPEFLVNQPTSL